jgi:hypothetical protein
MRWRAKTSTLQWLLSRPSTKSKDSMQSIDHHDFQHHCHVNWDQILKKYFN